jgi:hypothetical protein
MSYTMHTTFVVNLTFDLGGDGHDLSVRINYSVSKGYADTLEEPGCGPSVSINSISAGGADAPAWLWAMAEADESLTGELLAHAADCDERARDDAADARRDDLMMERF